MDPKRYHHIEHEILRLVLQDSDHLGHPTDLIRLATFFRQTLPDITNRELVDTLNNPAQISDDDEFFYRNGGIRLRRTPHTDPYLQELAALFPPQEPDQPKRHYGF